MVTIVIEILLLVFLAKSHVAFDAEIFVQFLRTEGDGAGTPFVIDPVAVRKLFDETVEAGAERDDLAVISDADRDHRQRCVATVFVNHRFKLAGAEIATAAQVINDFTDVGRLENSETVG